MVLKRIRTYNLQNHKEVVVDLPPTGLIVFTGNNSNGKSVIVKTTRALISNKISRPVKRASLINRNATYGEITYTRSDDVTLTLHLQREAAGTYVEYAEPGKTPIKRYLSDKSYKDLVTRFGWHYDSDTDISLNLSEAEEALLFYKTSPKVTGSAVQTATTDPVANQVVENFDNFISVTRKTRDSYKQSLQVYLAGLAELKVEEMEGMPEKLEKLEKCYRNLKAVYFPDIPEIKPVPKVHYVDPYIPQLPKIRYPKIVHVACSIPDITGIAKELKILQDKRCPTCGRRFDDGSENCENHVHIGPS